MSNRRITGGILVAVLVLVVWWMFVFSPVRSETSTVSADVDAAKAETQSLEAEAKQVADLVSRAPEIQGDLDRLSAAVPAAPELASFIDAANALGVEAGITWVSISPTEAVTTGTTETVSMSIQIAGGYYEVLDYLNRLEHLSRLVVIDEITLSGGVDVAETGAPALSASLTARMFSLASAAATEPAPAAITSTPAES